MYKIQVRRSVQATIDYFLRDGELSVEERSGVWVGRGAKMLGLVQSTPEERAKILDLRKPAVSLGMTVNERDLRYALHGYTPPSGEHAGRPLNGRYLPEGTRKCAWDIVLCPHKSISVAALCLRDEHAAQSLVVRSAHEDATLETFQFMECLARRSNGSRPDLETFALLAARFDHQVSRRNDPHLHTHFVTMNATHDVSGYGREWYALQSLQLYRQAREIDMVYQRALTQHLVSRGIDAKMLAIDGMPVAVLPSVDPAICHRLSRAHQHIQNQVADRWQREERTIFEKRFENRINDGQRPSKVGTLAVRADMFDRALSPSEAQEIVSSLYAQSPASQQSRIETTAPVLLPPTAVRHLVLGAGLNLGTAAPTPAQISRAALLAAAESFQTPFLQFWDSARWDLAKMLDAQWDDTSLGFRVDAMMRHWQFEEEQQFAPGQQKGCSPSNSTVKTQNLPNHPPPVDTRSRAYEPPAHDAPPGYVGPETPLGIPSSYGSEDHLGPSP
ncbi:MAG: relaxase domain-containing protein [Rhodospirillales bacterium]|nr:relaxase domain-containing protein [Acetobacter sp.]